MNNNKAAALACFSLLAAAFAACSSDDASPTVPAKGAAPDAAPLPLPLPDLDSGPADADSPEPFFDCTEDASAVEPPTHLRCTGLYERWTSKKVATTAREYAPGVMLWSDGAVKRRWIQLPAGTKIDTTNMDAWQFPVGTKLWKEFVLDGRRIETRLFWKVASTTWARTTYAWSADETTAMRLDVGASMNDAGDPDAGGYEIPSVAKCDRCHAGASDKILGFEAIGLGVPGATGVTLESLVADGLLTAPPATMALTIPEDGHGSAKALGWLHANCGTACHNANPSASCAFRGMFLKLSFAEVSTGRAVTALDAYTTTYHVPASLPAAGYERIAPGSLATSAIHWLATHRNNVAGSMQMPPIDSHRVDPTGTADLAVWIGTLPP